MKPASASAIEASIAILIDSISQENKGHSAPTSQRVFEPKFSSTGGLTIERLCRTKTPTEAHLHALNSRIKALQATGEAVRRSLEDHVIRIRREHNALAFIHKLPTELLATIIHHYLLPKSNNPLDMDAFNSQHQRYRRLEMLASVSRTWHAVVENTPSLWSEVRSWDRKGLVLKALRKSKEHPLVVDLLDVSLGFGDSPAETRPGCFTGQEFLCEVGQYLHRWSRAHLSLSRQDLLTPGVLEESAPRLTSLHVMLPLIEPATSVDLFGGVAPALQDVSLHGIAVRDWSSPIFRGLRSLTIVGPAMVPPSVQQLVNMIRGSPLLEFIRFEYIRQHERTSVEENSIPVVLQHLRVLNLSGLPPVMLEIILNSIRVPATCKLQLGCKYVAAPTTFTLGHSLSHFLPGLNSLLLKCRRLELNLGRSSLSCWESSKIDSPDFRLFVNGMNPAKPLEWLLGALEEALGTLPVKVNLEDDFDLGDEEVTRRLWSMACVTEMEIYEETPSVERVFEALSEPVVTDGQGRWRFPRLRHLRVYPTTGFNPFSVLRMVESRYGITTGTPNPVLPTPFYRLKLRELPKNVTAEIKRIVGGDKVMVGDIWDSDYDEDAMDEDEEDSDEE